MTDKNKNSQFYQELNYVVKPKIDHIKESTGGDYVLQNSSKDRRYNSECWMSSNPKENNSNKSNTSNMSDSQKYQNFQISAPKSRYVPPSMSKKRDKDAVLSENRFSSLANLSNTDDNPGISFSSEVKNRGPVMGGNNYNQHPKKYDANFYTERRGYNDNSKNNRYGGNSNNGSYYNYSKNRNNKYNNLDKNTKDSGYLDLNKIPEQINIASVAEFPVLSNRNEKTKLCESWGKKDTTEMTKPVLNSLKKIESSETDKKNDEEILDGWFEIPCDKPINKTPCVKKLLSFADIAKKDDQSSIVQNDGLEKKENRVSEINQFIKLPPKRFKKPAHKTFGIFSDYNDNDYSYNNNNCGYGNDYYNYDDAYYPPDDDYNTNDCNYDYNDNDSYNNNNNNSRNECEDYDEEFWNHNL
nr:probable serine/threonine-protein kinase clkA [Hydra vulgaris]